MGISTATLEPMKMCFCTALHSSTLSGDVQELAMKVKRLAGGHIPKTSQILARECQTVSDPVFWVAPVIEFRDHVIQLLPSLLRLSCATARVFALK